MADATLTPRQAVELWRETCPDMPVPAHLVEAAGGSAPRKAPPFFMACYGSAEDAEAFSAFCEQRHVRATIRQTEGRAYRLARRKE